jgi:hypothetical protein
MSGRAHPTTYSPRHLAALTAPLLRADDIDHDVARTFVLFKGERWTTILTLNR